MHIFALPYIILAKDPPKEDLRIQLQLMVALNYNIPIEIVLIGVVNANRDVINRCTSKPFVDWFNSEYLSEFRLSLPNS